VTVTVTDTTTPVLIYAPGLGRYPENTADSVADVLARILDRLDTTATFGTTSDPDIAAPRGLRVAKTIVDGADAPVLQLFELDYRPALEPPGTVAGPSVVPGLLRAIAYASLAGFKWWAALRRPAKGARTKVQLGIGLLATGALIFAALVAIYSALVALGVDLPLTGVFGEDAAPWVFGISLLGLVITWTALRKKILGLAGISEKLIRFVRNEDTAGDSTSVVMDEAIDGLRQNGWKGPIHLLGYSFGSLVLYEAMFPRTTSRRDNAPATEVSSLVTIGCPLDIVRLYQPDYPAGRDERRPQLRWTNVFNEADIFASNLSDNDDTSAGPGEAARVGMTTPECVRYLDEKLSWFRVFASGKIHAGYWGAPSRANCFEAVAAIWRQTPAG
jgi:hypothetical protein